MWLAVNTTFHLAYKYLQNNWETVYEEGEEGEGGIRDKGVFSTKSQQHVNQLIFGNFQIIPENFNQIIELYYRI